MKTMWRTWVGALCLWAALVSPGSAQQAEKRIALVIGNSAYPDHVLPTAANDGGLIAQTLQAAGFDVVGARDLDAESLRRALRDFVQKAETSGPNTVAFVYLAGYGLQVSGENYFVPIGAAPLRDTDIAAETLRIADYVGQLRAMPLKAGIVVLDAARETPFAKAGQSLAGGLALVEPDARIFIAYNAAPGTVAPEGSGSYGPYAQSLAEMIRTGGLSLPDVFERTRLRVSDVTKGAQVPWDTRKIDAPFMFFDRAADAPATTAGTPDPGKPMSAYDANAAYAVALAHDTLPAYEAFLAAYPNDAMAKRVRVIIAARREAITWRRSYVANTPDAYWSYLRRYPKGPHAPDARRRLSLLAAAYEPPPTFTMITYDVPPPPPEEIVYLERPYVVFSDPYYAFAPPPPPPVYFLPPPPPDFIILPPPVPVFSLFVLPRPLFVPFPAYVVPPPYIAPPPNNVIFANIHNTTVINNVINQPAPVAAPAAGAGVLSAAPPPAGTPALPPSVAQRAALIQDGKIATPPGVTARPANAVASPPPAAGAAPARLGAPLPQVAPPPPVQPRVNASSERTAIAPVPPSAVRNPVAPAARPMLMVRTAPGGATPRVVRPPSGPVQAMRPVPPPAVRMNAPPRPQAMPRPAAPPMAARPMPPPRMTAPPPRMNAPPRAGAPRPAAAPRPSKPHH